MYESVSEAYETLGLTTQATLEQVKKQFVELSKRYHPDLQSGDRIKYYKITQAYNKILSHSSETNQNEGPKRRSFFTLKQKIDQSKKLVKKEVLLKEYLDPFSKPVAKVPKNDLLTCVVSLWWKDLLESWAQGKSYTKTFSYYYNQTCYCEELCPLCNGGGVTQKDSVCKSCNNKGVVNHCDQCKGTGMRKHKDSGELEFQVGLEPEVEKLLPYKGNVVKEGLREPLRVKLHFNDEKIRKGPNLFLFSHDIRLQQLMESVEIRIPVVSNRGLVIRPVQLKKIPLYVNVSSFFQKVYLNSLGLRCFMRIGLDLST